MGHDEVDRRRAPAVDEEDEDDEEELGVPLNYEGDEAEEEDVEELGVSGLGSQRNGVVAASRCAWMEKGSATSLLRRRKA